jgi:hypothetical protein
MDETSTDFWRKCSQCKKQIAFGQQYWICNVSTCNQKRTGFVFCSVNCWDAHLPIMRHKNAWAEERQAPTKGKTAHMSSDLAKKTSPKITPPQPSLVTKLKSPPSEEILVVASKVKGYVKTRSGLNTSGAVMESLSNLVRKHCDRAIRSAQNNERKTVLDRDVE